MSHEKTFTYDEVLKASLEYFNQDELAAKVFADKYALRDGDGNFVELTPDDLHRRLAKEFARIEAKYPNPLSESEIYESLKDFKEIVAQGSPMAAVGNPYQIMSSSNCYVIESPWDSYGGILKTDQEEAHIMKRRGGVGFDISNIRPHGLRTNNAAKTTDGIAIFMERFSNTCREVAQNGRRGALMLSISVHHPDILTFINIKRDKKKVTGANVSVRVTDEFMKAVESGSQFELRWPVESKEPTVSKMVDAKEIWHQLISAAHESAEPGILFWDAAEKYTPADIYREFGYRSISTNPCLSGDTLIAVADGRNAVSIKQLAEEGKDVSVYSVDKVSGKVSIKWGRNPRITGYNKKLVRVTLDDKSHFDVTPDHKCILRDGTEVLAKDLKPGDSLPSFSKRLEKVSKHNNDPYFLVHCDVRDYHADRVFEHRLIAKFHFPQEWNDVKASINNQAGCIKTGGLVVHHKDYNQLNNNPDNLQIMTWREHQKLHAQQDTQGEKNGRYSGFTKEQIKEHAIKLTKKLGHRFSGGAWQEYAKEHGLPQNFSAFRKDQFGSADHLAKLCASELGMEHIDKDPRLVKTLQDMLSQGYDAKIEDHKVFVAKVCEGCKSDFFTKYLTREQAFCSKKCGTQYVNSNTEFQKKRADAIAAFNEQKSVKTKENQARIYSELKFKLGRNPMMKEWEVACKNEKVPCRVGKIMKYGFKTFAEVAEAGDNYNHKVVSVQELDGNHTVYNITVDDNHTFAIVTKFDGSHVGQGNQTGVYVANCGEIILSSKDSCRLMCVNLLPFVDNPYLPTSSFNYERYGKAVIKAQRLMDDLIDLELEILDKIIAKVEADPEPLSVKQIELDLWKGVREACANGRRTGLGITALGDTLAALGIKYGSDESVVVTGEIYKHLAINAYRSTCILAGERGAFPAFSHELEKGHPFLQRLWDADPELYQLYLKNGRRNIALTTTAPTGSVSMMTQTTSGIEPAYLLSYVRRKKVNPSDNNVRVDFVDHLGDSWQEFTVYHHGIKRWMDATGKTDIKMSPYWGATSTDVDWVNGTKLQGAAQHWLCHSISRTQNLPNDVTVDVVKDIYMNAWKAGCKGYTVYREGSRTGVLVSSEEHKKQSVNPNERPSTIRHMMSPKRPDTLPCEIKKVKIQGEAWTIFVGLMDNSPYEIFGGLSKFVEIPNKYKAGLISKADKSNGVSQYNLTCGEGEDQIVVKDIANVFENATNGAFTRTLSLALRHGAAPQYVVEQLQKDKNSDMTSFSKVIARVLKTYIKDGTKSASDKKCVSCGQDNSIVYVEGCLTCTSCGASKCG